MLSLSFTFTQHHNIWLDYPHYCQTMSPIVNSTRISIPPSNPRASPLALAPGDLLLDIALFLETRSDLLNFCLTVCYLYYTLKTEMTTSLSHIMSLLMFLQCSTNLLSWDRLNNVASPWECFRERQTLLGTSVNSLSDHKQNTSRISVPRTTLLPRMPSGRLQAKSVWMLSWCLSGMQTNCRIMKTCGSPCELGELSRLTMSSWSWQTICRCNPDVHSYDTSEQPLVRFSLTSTAMCVPSTPISFLRRLTLFNGLHLAVRFSRFARILSHSEKWVLRESDKPFLGGLVIFATFLFYLYQ